MRICVRMCDCAFLASGFDAASLFGIGFDSEVGLFCLISENVCVSCSSCFGLILFVFILYLFLCTLSKINCIVSNLTVQWVKGRTSSFISMILL